jgi:hypothetical protein
LLSPQPHLSQEAGQDPSQRQAGLERPPLTRRAIGVLRELFPEPAELVRRRVPGGMSVLLLSAAVPLGVLVMLVRVAGTPVPAWDSIYGEDLGIFLVQALQHPWHLLVGYAGYLQLVPRLIAQFVVYLPLRDAAAAFAVSGALVTTGCALFIFHASAGHVRSAVLRFVLALAVVLLPVAQLEIADSAVNSPWYLLFALFWAVVWRPGTRVGMAGATAVGFLTAASTTMSVVFAPLLLARVVALPRLREHAVTAGWAAGCLLQVPFVASNLDSAQSRAAHLAAPGRVLAFYGHEVVLPALGWHLAWWLQAFAGRNGATLIIGAFLAAFFGWALLTQRGQARVFVVACLITGFLSTVFGAILKPGVTTTPVTVNSESGSRYTALPIFLIEAAAVVVVGSFICHKRHRLRTVAAVTALVGVLSVGWVTDFRYQGWRGNTVNWPPTATAWLHACQRMPDGVIRVPTGASFNGAKTAVPCSSLRRLCRAARSRGAGGSGGACRERDADPPGGRSGWPAAARARRQHPIIMPVAASCPAATGRLNAPLFGGVRKWCVGALRTDADEEPVRPGLWRWRRATHMEVVHHLVERSAGVVSELHGAVDGGVSAVRCRGEKAVQQQRHSPVAHHVRRLAAALDRAEEDVVTLGFDEDYRHLR